MLGDMLENLVRDKVGDFINQQVTRGASGTDEALHDVVGTILGGLAKNSNRSGAGGLADALDRDHDGSILDDIGDVVETSEIGKGILKHVLGSQREQIEQMIAEKTGLPAAAVSQIYNLVAPLMMGKLGKEKKEQGLDTSRLGDILKSESEALHKDTKLSPFLALLDRDGDGDVDLHDIL